MPKRKFIIICEGKNTEPQYFSAVRRKYPGALIDIEIVKAAGVPMTIAALAKETINSLTKNKKRSGQSHDKNDEVWAVFDRDDHPSVPDAIRICRESKVGLAYSNTCFETWLLLHYEDFDRPDGRHDVQRRLEEICPEYLKRSGKTPNCDELVQNLELAEQRADAQLERRIADGKENGRPSTTVQNLTRALREANDEFEGAES